jgi:hypothetical protein
MKNKILNNEQEIRQYNFDTSRNVMYIDEWNFRRMKIVCWKYAAIIYVNIGAPGGTCQDATPPHTQRNVKNPDGVDTIISKGLRDLHFCLKHH